MAISSKLQQYLERESVSFDVAQHPLTYTAIETAGSQHIPGKQLVKSVVVKSDGEFLMCVMPSIHLIDFEKLKSVLGKKVELADEEDLAKIFPDYELGAEPPFGHLYGLKVYSDQILEEEEEIVFNAGTHTDVVRMKYQDFKRLVNPIVKEIGMHI